MSEHPLIPQNTVIIVACANTNQANDALAQYGADVVAQVSMTVCVTIANANAAIMALPPETPWTKLEGASPYTAALLKQTFGEARTMADCLKAQNQEYAISPAKLRT
jgi:hypothetical protein